MGDQNTIISDQADSNDPIKAVSFPQVIQKLHQAINSKKKRIITFSSVIFILVLLTLAGWLILNKSKKASKIFDFPIYPNALYVGEKYIPPCNEEELRRACGGIDYSWETKDSFESVLRWYESESNSGWKLAGGDGDYGVTRAGWFSDGNQKYWLILSLSSPEISQSTKTFITVFIPDSEINTKENNFVNSVLFWKRGKPSLVDIQTGFIKELNLGDLYIENQHMYATDLQKYYNPVFSPDKKWIVFGSNGDIWKIGADGNGLQQITKQAKQPTEDKWGVEATNPRLSPDGKLILYDVLYPADGEGPAFTPEEERKFKPEIESGYWMIDFNSGVPIFLPGLEYPVDWMSDNARIIFTSKEKTYAYNTFSKEISSLLNYPIYSLSWSADGNTVVYSTNDTIYLADSNLKTLATLPRRKEVAPLSTSSKTEEFIEYASLSPDGKYVLLVKPFIFYSKNGTRMWGDKIKEYEFKVPVSLWDTQTKQVTKVSTYFSSHAIPFWSKDSKKIAYVKEFNNPDPSLISSFGDIYVYDLETNRENQITTSGDYHPFDMVF